MTVDMASRIRERVTVEFSCWVFCGARQKNGYGVVSNRRGGSRMAHRVMWEARNGPVPTGLELDHLCRNRACVNPAHLEPVTRAENVARGRWARGRRRVTHCIRGHEYTPENSWHWRTKRYCKTCLRDQQRAKRARRTEEARRLSLAVREPTR